MVVRISGVKKIRRQQLSVHVLQFKLKFMVSEQRGKIFEQDSRDISMTPEHFLLFVTTFTSLTSISRVKFCNCS